MDSLRDFSAEAFVNNSSISVFTGSNSAQIIDRCSSTDVAVSPKMTRVETLFCNSNGRIEDFATLCFVDGGILMIGMPQLGDQTRLMIHNGVAWDELASIRSGENAVKHIVLFGSDINKSIVGLGMDLDEFSSANWVEFGNTIISRNHKRNEDVYDVIIPISESLGFLRMLEENGCKEVQQNRWDFFRIANSIMSKSDIIGRIPHEVGLAGLIDTSKGCYPGQEIHARLESRGKTKRKLVKLICSAEIPIGRVSSTWGKIEVTSTGINMNEHIALAVVPMEFSESGEEDLGFGNVKISPINHR